MSLYLVYLFGLYIACYSNPSYIYHSELNFIDSNLLGQVFLSDPTSGNDSTLRFIRSEINSGSYAPIYFGTSPEYTSIYLQDINLITTTTPIYFDGNYYGTLEVNLSDANQWVYSSSASDWYTPSDINVHIVAAADPAQYFLITDLNDVGGGGKVNVVCDFNTAMTPEECAAEYVKKPS